MKGKDKKDGACLNPENPSCTSWPKVSFNCPIKIKIGEFLRGIAQVSREGSFTMTFHLPKERGICQNCHYAEISFSLPWGFLASASQEEELMDY
jgi:hypothetical protein